MTTPSYGIDDGVLCISDINFDAATPGNNAVTTTDAELLIGSTAAPYWRRGNLTSPDGSIIWGYSGGNITASVDHAANGISLRPYIVGATNSDFTTIQAAINQAVSDGASSSSPRMILVKFGTYVEDLTLADGIFVSGLDTGNLIDGDETIRSVTITGQISLSSGKSKLINVHLSDNAGTVINFTGGTLILENVSADLTSSVLLNFLTSATKNIYITACNFVGDINSAFCTNDSSASTVKVATSQSYVSFLGQDSAIIDTSASWIFTFRDSEILTSFTFEALDTLVAEFDGCYHQAATGIELFRTSSSGASLSYYNCTLQPSGTPFSIGASTNFQITDSYINCAFSDVWSTFRDMLPSNFTVQEGQVRRGQISGFSYSYILEGMAGIQTTDATQTAALTFAVSSSQSITIKGSFKAAKTDYTKDAGGMFCATFARGAGALAQTGEPWVFQNAGTSGYSLTLDANANNIRILVTGAAAESVDWIIEFLIMTMDGST